MKTLIIFLFCGCMLSANQLFAQKQKSNLLPVVTITSGNDISRNVRDAFFDRFKDAENLRWFEINQNYLVKFIMDDQEHHATFRKNGELIYHISYGVEKNLPESIKRQVKYRYDKYAISRVFMVESGDRSVWIVNLENKKNYVITSIEDNRMSEVARYKNATATQAPVVSLGN
jgi:hypothetical protein